MTKKKNRVEYYFFYNFFFKLGFFWNLDPLFKEVDARNTGVNTFFI